jgi:ribosomal-protein-alanine N-acetyltransferase
MKTAPTIPLEIIPATQQDLDHIVRIEQASFPAPWTRKMFEAELNGNPFGSLVTARAIRDGVDTTLVGYICFWVVFEELRLMNLAVDQTARRQGVAAELVRRALAVGRDRGAMRAILEVRASNVPARQLYEQAGFRQTALRANYYTHPVEDAVIMGMEPLEAATSTHLMARSSGD